MIAIGLLLVLLLISAFVGAIGFLIGYFVGRRSAAKDRQTGFPVLPVQARREESDQPTGNFPGSPPVLILFLIASLAAAVANAQQGRPATSPAFVQTMVDDRGEVASAVINLLPLRQVRPQ